MAKTTNYLQALRELHFLRVALIGCVDREERARMRKEKAKYEQIVRSFESADDRRDENPRGQDDSVSHYVQERRTPDDASTPVEREGGLRMRHRPLSGDSLSEGMGRHEGDSDPV